MNVQYVLTRPGIRSVPRRAVLGRELTLDSAISAYICRVPNTVVESIPDNDVIKGEHNIWLGPGQVAVMLPLHDEHDMVFPHFSTAGKAADWNRWGDVDALRKQYSSFHPAIRSLLEHVERATLWRLEELPPLESWVSASGRVVVIGDAAHAMLPYAGQVRRSPSPRQAFIY